MILITEFMDETAVEKLQQHHKTKYDPGLADRQNELASMMDRVTAIIVRNRTQVTKELLQAAPDLACVGRLGVGLDNIDLDACKAAGVAVFPASGANNMSVAEYVITAAMTLLRGTWFANDAMIAGNWPRQACAGREIAGKTLGLVGYGAIARDTARLAEGLGMTIMAFDPFLPPDNAVWGQTENAPLDTLLERSDVVSLHVPLTDDTRHLINADRLALMKDDAILINAARGGVVDETALVTALSNNTIGAASLDVFETEPLTKESGEKFTNVPNLILTPHIAGVTEESNIRVSAVTADNVLKHLARAFHG